MRISITPSFLKDLRNLGKQDEKAAWAALRQLARTPKAKGLRLKPIGDDGVWSIRALRDVRIGLHKEADNFRAIAVGKRDSFYERLERLALQARTVLTFDLDVAAEGPAARTDAHASKPPDQPLSDITNDQLRSQGASPALIQSLRAAKSEDELLDLVQEQASWLQDLVLVHLDKEQNSLFRFVEENRALRNKLDQVQAELEQASSGTPQDLEAPDNEDLRDRIDALTQDKSQLTEKLVFLEEYAGVLGQSESQLRVEQEQLQQENQRIEQLRNNDAQQYERVMQDPDLKWKDEYPASPSSFLEVAAFFHNRLQTRQPPFQDLIHPYEEASGSWGTVYSTGIPAGNAAYGARRKAVKLPRRNAPDEEALQRAWKSEEQAARKLRGHNIEGIVRVERVAPDGYPGFLVYEWIEGRLLASELRRGPLGYTRAADVIFSITATLQRLLEQEIWFSDLHAGNILIRPHQGPVLIDPAACIPGQFGPPEWFMQTNHLPHDRCDVAAFEHGQTFMLAHLLLQCICPAETLGAILPSPQHTQHDQSGFSSLACMMRVTEQDDAAAISHERLREQVQAAAERDGDVRSCDSIVEIIRFALHDEPSQRPTLRDFANTLRQ